MPSTQISVPLAVSFDQRGVVAATNMDALKDQVRKNCMYKITRQSVGAPPDVVLVRRQGISDSSITLGGTTSQKQYLVGEDPNDTYLSFTPWIIAKEGNDNKVVIPGGLSHTILSSANFFPRFYRTIRLVVDDVSTNYAMVSFQNTSSPNGAGAIRVFGGTAYNSWTEITDADFTAIHQVGCIEQMDGFLYQGDARGRIYQSDPNSGTSWEPLEYFTRTLSQEPAQGIAKHRNQIIFFGVGDVEVFTNQGETTGTSIDRVPFSTQHIGLSSLAGDPLGLVGKTEYYCTLGDMMFFLGRFGKDVHSANLIVYDGRQFQKVSKPHEDAILSSAPIYGIFRVAVMGHVGVACVFTQPTEATQKAFIFFPELNDWFHWESTVFGFANNGYHFAGVINSTKTYAFSQADVWQDAGVSYDMVVQFRLPLPDLGWRTMPFCGVVGDTTSTSQNLAVSFSDDDGATYSTARNIDMATLYKILTMNGGFRQRFVKLTHSGDKEIRLRKYFATIN